MYAQVCFAYGISQSNTRIILRVHTTPTTVRDKMWPLAAIYRIVVY